MSLRGSSYDPRPPRAPLGERALLLLVVVALVLAVGLVYVRLLVDLLERVAVPLK